MPGRVSIAALLMTACITLAGGCVKRTLQITSDPVGALVWVNDREIGRTPLELEFVYYGTRRIKLIKDGYETLTTLQTIKAPWYQVPPLDFASENLIGREIRDERVLDFTMKPQQTVPASELMTRANNLRTSANLGVIAPLPPQRNAVPVAAPGPFIAPGP